MEVGLFAGRLKTKHSAIAALAPPHPVHVLDVGGGQLERPRLCDGPRVTDTFALVAKYLQATDQLSWAASGQPLMQDTRSAY
jgi:hypothetical protein